MSDIKHKTKVGMFWNAFENYDFAYAYVLENPIRYSKAISLEELNIKNAPQSYIYITEKLLKNLIK